MQNAKIRIICDIANFLIPTDKKSMPPRASHRPHRPAVPPPSTAPARCPQGPLPDLPQNTPLPLTYIQ